MIVYPSAIECYWWWHYPLSLPCCSVLTMPVIVTWNFNLYPLVPMGREGIQHFQPSSFYCDSPSLIGLPNFTFSLPEILYIIILMIICKVDVWREGSFDCSWNTFSVFSYFSANMYPAESLPLPRSCHRSQGFMWTNSCLRCNGFREKLLSKQSSKNRGSSCPVWQQGSFTVSKFLPTSFLKRIRQELNLGR